MIGKPPKEIELHADAWDRFLQAVHVMAKAGPQHRVGGVTVKSGPEHRSQLKSANVGDNPRSAKVKGRRR
jgi:hypothetical protein